MIAGGGSLGVFEVRLDEGLTDREEIDGAIGAADFDTTTATVNMFGSAHPRSILVAGMAVVTPQQPPVRVLDVEPILLHLQVRGDMQPHTQAEPRGDQRAGHLDDRRIGEVGDIDGELAGQRVRPPGNLVDGVINGLR